METSFDLAKSSITIAVVCLMSECLIFTRNKIVKFVRKVVLLLNESRDLAWLACFTSNYVKTVSPQFCIIFVWPSRAWLLIRNTSSLLGFIQTDKLEDPGPRAGNSLADSHRLSSPSSSFSEHSSHNTRFVLLTF